MEYIKHELIKLNKKLSYRRDSAGRRSLRRSWSFKVTDVSTNRKHVCDFLLLHNTNLHPILHHFEAIAEYFWSNYRKKGVPLFHALLGDSLKSRL